ncbi:23S rRNA pseudouridine(1911/1915/1917) synthase RluD [Rhodanobacter sp. 7MK24]|uniref:23S rRNA pseudouridine(1911/1915/1917) synthase RluD n=1 Tax=Rhodanobacter sp. 7MK24 TaxID=2775922 RepID=UPI001780AF68|nr:23S rRNA pseudouridine(1911/1915/1917) synthase RluD [Rhodanobacter sp. 7MK24]MBD8878877.1 23S rRNA pseudouridine(1911/1915/1917) synthase RluD [Rhodanobacter sp. 7MK24]
MTVISHEARVPLALAGRRFDQVLAELFPDYSRSRLTGWIKSGAATLDGAMAPPRLLLKGGELVQLEAELETEVESAPEDIALTIVHEDEHLLVLDKPAGLVVHPGAGKASGTLLNALLHHDPKLAELPRAGIVHRLDKDTSGLMVVAKTLPTMTALVERLSNHDVQRQYEAVVLGSMVSGGTVDAPIGRSMGDRLRQAVREDETGKHAVTHYRLRERFRAHSLLQCNLETGRTHQIRVHLTHIGHPLVGDPLYGGGLKLPKRAMPELVTALRGFRRQALHAERLAFEHPATGEALSFAAPRPDDMNVLIAALRDDLAAHGHDD